MVQETPSLQPQHPAPMAIYANYFVVGHNAFEFLIDFGQFQPDASAERMHSRIVTGPVHAKLLCKLLTEAVARFEKEHGEIDDLSEPEIDALLIPPADFEERAIQARANSIPPIATKR